MHFICKISKKVKMRLFSLNVLLVNMNFPSGRSKASQTSLALFKKTFCCQLFQLYTTILIIHFMQQHKMRSQLDLKILDPQIKAQVVYLSRAPISLVTFSDV